MIGKELIILCEREEDKLKNHYAVVQIASYWCCTEGMAYLAILILSILVLCL